MELVENARDIAEQAHAGQVRKSDGSPYIAHPIAVAEILKQHGFSEVVIAAGLTHDVLEDTEVGEAELRAQLGDAVVAIVTGVSEDKSLPWEERKQQYIDAVVAASDDVKAVSVADKIHNAQSFLEAYAEQGNALWEKFSRGPEKTIWFQVELCRRLQAVWQHPLLDEYARLVQELQQLT